MKKDCCFQSGKNWFRYRAAGLVVQDDKVLFVSDKSLDYLYTVGGGVHMGESSEDCVIRELKEETGVDFEIDHLAVICENFFKGKGGVIDKLKCHCIEFYFVMKGNGVTDFSAESVNADGHVEEMVWVPIDKIDEYNIKPAFLKEKIKEIVYGDSLIHIITDADMN